ncbi:hypothetical protein JHFBIEKO_0211 [Methylobacterium mesophilicum]|uniref:hypothetical protein n=1 Tax=Methylobacterium mesophilicum TaxID=39956 RepID=UPI001EE32835|nr:hypothetical protein [Methylobacterium mesophilicum]GJE19792.1 hypothetical protein JHFBIEKO_0211 [Methylobacterium mesophilicum]
MTQLSFMHAVDAALTTGFPCGSWWWPAWKAGDPLPPGWRPPVPGADNPKPRLPAGSPPGIACDGDEIDIEIAKALDAWRPAGMSSPFVGIYETRRLACGAAWARLEAWDAGLSHATVRGGIIEWGYVPGAGELVALDGQWTRIPEEEGPDPQWTETWKLGDAIPPGLMPPVGGEVLPTWYYSHDGMRDEQIAMDVWQAVWDGNHPGAPFPFENVTETHVLPDGALWACLTAVHDGGLSHVTLRDGVLEWTEAPGAGLLVYAADTRTWGRLPAKETWDAEAAAWVPKASSTEAVSAPPDAEALKTSASAPPDAEAIDTSASAPSDVDPEPAVPAVAPLPSGGIQAFLHAHNLATNFGWKTLAGSLSRTTPGDVRNAVAGNIAGGSLSDANARTLLACIEATDPPADVVTEVAPEAEFPDVDPVYGTRRAPPPPPDFMEELARKQAEGRARRQEAWRPLEALADAGLAQLPTFVTDRTYLLPPASDSLMLWYDPNFGRPKDVSLWIIGPDVDPDILTRIESILGVTARGAATSIRLLEVAPP